MRFVVLGHPIAHSRSPAIHAAALAAAGIDGRYEARDVDARGLAGAFEEVRDGRLDGANITMPHKAAAALMADRRTAIAARCAAANTWFRDRSGVVADSTDGAGLTFALDQAGIPAELPAFVLGAGGAAAAALVTLEGRAPAVSARRPEAAHALLDQLEMEAEVVPWGESRAGRLVVNATPIGMRGELLPAPILEEAAALVDMVYGSEPTPSVRAARHRDLPVADGLEMLVGQAAASFELWTGVAPDVAAMRRAAAKNLKGPGDTAENAE